MTAGSIVVALGRRTALILTNRGRLDERGVGDMSKGQVLPGTFAMARSGNRLVAQHARRFVYRHPDDDLSDLLGSGWSPPTPSPDVLDSGGSEELRDKLTAMSRWAALHPDEPHPMSAWPALPTPPPDARPLAVEGRGRRRRAVEGRMNPP